MAVAALVGGVVSGVGALIGGEQAQANAEFEAKQLTMQAAQQRAAASRDAEEKGQETKLALSRVQAVAAASGGGAGVDAPTVSTLGESIAKRGKYFALTELANGESRARGLLDEATSRRIGGQNAMTAGLIGAGSSVLNGVSQYSLYSNSRFGFG